MLSYEILISTYLRISHTGGLDSLVNVWHLNVESLENVYQLNNNELHSTMHGHTAAITCLAIASNGLFAVSGSEDKLVLVWGLTVGNAVFTFSVSTPENGLGYKVGLYAYNILGVVCNNILIYFRLFLNYVSHTNDCYLIK